MKTKHNSFECLSVLKEKYKHVNKVSKEAIANAYKSPKKKKKSKPCKNMPARMKPNSQQAGKKDINLGKKDINLALIERYKNKNEKINVKASSVYAEGSSLSYLFKPKKYQECLQVGTGGSGSGTTGNSWFLTR